MYKSLSTSIKPFEIKGKYFVAKNRLIPVKSGENPTLDIAIRTTQKANSNLYIQKTYGGYKYISSLYPLGKPTNKLAQARVQLKDRYNHSFKDYTQWTLDYEGKKYLLTTNHKTADILEIF